jgi:[protein-PII] uridylyltransferase
VLVYTKDVADLFARICSYFAHRLISIQDARIHTTRDAYALDSFVVLPSETNEDLRTIAALIEHELTQHLDAPQDTRRSSDVFGLRGSRLSKAFPFPPIVELRPDERSQSWRLDVIASDRPGLLGDLAQVFVSYAINLQTAKVMTLGDRIEDVFVISGEALARPRTQRQFERAVLEVLGVEQKNAA